MPGTSPQTADKEDLTLRYSATSDDTGITSTLGAAPVEERDYTRANANSVTQEAEFVGRGVSIAVTAPAGSVPEGVKIQITYLGSPETGEERFSILLLDSENNIVQLEEGSKLSLRIDVQQSAPMLAEAIEIDVIRLSYSDNTQVLVSDNLSPDVTTILFDTDKTGAFALKLIKQFERPKIELYGFPSQRVPAMIDYSWGTSQETIEPRGAMPDSVIPGFNFPVDLSAVTEIQLLEDDSYTWYNSPYHQDYFKQIRARYTVRDDRSLYVEKVSGNGTVEYDKNTNTIKIFLESKELQLDTPELVNTFYNNGGTGRSPYNSYYAHYFAFTPAEDGEYNYFLSDNAGGEDTFGAIFDSEGNLLASDYDSGESNNFSIKKYRLEAGKTYYFGVTLYDYNTDVHGDYYINLTKEAPPEAPVIKDVSESYIFLNVKKEWIDSKSAHDPVTVYLTPALGTINEIVLSEDNGWEGTFENLPCMMMQEKK